ncbi:MAG: aldehyde dehydrogenase family protein [Pseudomonadota bacterium]
MTNTRNFYINGAWTAPAAANDAPVINPSTEQEVATITLGTQADTDAAVAAAKAAFPAWSALTLEERLAPLERLIDAYKAGKDKMSAAMTAEMGAPKQLSEGSQYGAGLWHMKEAVRAARAFAFEHESGDDLIYHEPIGVCALITPWNWPMNQVTLKVMPALAVGCTVVLKPSEIAPLSSVVFSEMIDEAGFPPGVFNMVNGDGAGVGTQLSVHPDVDMVSFTGSTRAGSLITKNAADSVKRVSLELGGKGANLVFADADEKAVVRGVRHCFQNTGQSCNAPTRMLIEASVYDQAVATAVATAEKTTVGPAAEDGRHIGPVVSEGHWTKIQGLIQDGIDEGARLVAGGTGKPDGMNAGYFVKPTIFADVTNDMKIAQEEIFGPVLAMIPFETEEEAVAIANDTDYGLTNYVQTQDPARAKRLSRQLRSGMVQVNGTGLGAQTPFGGYKQSGNGREGSTWGLEEFMEVKAVSGVA